MSELQEFITKYKDEINNNRFDYVYTRANSSVTPVLTSLLYDIGVDPLPYLRYVPNNFMTDVKLDAIELPSNIIGIDNTAFVWCEIKIFKVLGDFISIGDNSFRYSSINTLILPPRFELDKDTFRQIQRLNKIIINTSETYEEWSNGEDKQAFVEEYGLPKNIEIYTVGDLS